MASNKRARQLARERYERRMAKVEQARARRRRRNQVIAVVVAVLLVGGGATALATTLGGDGKPAAAASPSPSASPSRAPQPCAYTKEGTPAKAVPLPTFDFKAARTPYSATLKTNLGDITFDALTAPAPCATYSFQYLAAHKFFDSTPCHRLLTGADSVLQCGDPTGTGTGGPGYRFPDENLPTTGPGDSSTVTYDTGTVAMANSGPDTNGSQFFLVFGPSPFPPAYTPFGKITAGLDVLKKIAQGGVVGQDTPKTKVNIESVTITKK